MFCFLIAALASAYTNVLGTPLKKCSSAGMALTGFTRQGECVDEHDDDGSHHICIDMASNTGGNFCTVTGQPNWCASKMACDGDTSSSCAVKHWCVCQWAFAAYIERAGGCDKIQRIDCEATNMVALKAYREQAAKSAEISSALKCLESKCDVQHKATTGSAQTLRLDVHG
jgi:uncharacterized protein (DUF2237 family)